MLQSCKQKNTPSPTNNNPDTTKKAIQNCKSSESPSQCLIDSYYFKPGSYWIYKTSAGATDSIYVLNNTTSPSENPYCHPPECCRIDYKTYFNHLHTPSLDQSSLSYYGNGFISCITLDSTNLFIYNYSSIPCFGFKIYPCKNSTNSNTPPVSYDSLLVGNTYYYNVIKIKVTNINSNCYTGDLTLNNQLFLMTNFYICPSHGIIKREAAQSDSSHSLSNITYIDYNLVRSNIVR